MKRPLADIDTDLEKVKGIISPNSTWKHVKTGDEYIIVGISVHSEDECVLVNYARLDHFKSGSNAYPTVWARPADMFLDGRFEMISRESIPKLRAKETVN